MLAALLVAPACDSTDGLPPAGDKAAAKPSEAAPPAEPEAKAKPVVKKVDEWQKALDARVLADSGLGVGGKLSAFDIFNCDTGEKYCQVCRYGPNPKVMAVGVADDEAFQEDLRNLDAIVQKYGDDKLKAFAVITELEGGKATTPKDPAALQEKAKALKAKLGISMPVVVPAPEQDGPNRIWDEYYNITQSRTVMFADGKNVVKYSGVAPEDFSKLNDAIVEVIGS
jgi:hypothetical protein